MHLTWRYLFNNGTQEQNNKRKPKPTTKLGAKTVFVHRSFPSFLWPALSFPLAFFPQSNLWAPSQRTIILMICT